MQDVGTVSSLRMLKGVVRSSCEQLLASLFGEDIASALISFEDTPLTVKRVKKLLELYDAQSPTKFRSGFAGLIGTHDVNAQFPETVCEWLNAHRELIPRADQSFTFSSKVSTLLSFSVWTGDIFCVELALMAGGRTSWETTNPPFAISKPVRRCLQESADIWNPFAARGMEVAGQSETFLGKGSFADVYRSSFRNQTCAAKRFQTGLKGLSINKLDEVLTHRTRWYEDNH